MVITPTFSIEQEYWSNSIRHIAGLDEAGMGALAGPVVAGAVIFSSKNIDELEKEIVHTPIRDSKLLSVKQREKAVDFIKAHAAFWAIGTASVEEIDTHNIRKASHMAMRRAIDSLGTLPDMLMVDGTSASIHPAIYSLSFIKGDQLSYSIAAASILAKVARDTLMQELHSALPMYGFDSHKGYGAKKHMDALAIHGITEHHRTSYAPIAKLTKSE